MRSGLALSRELCGSGSAEKKGKDFLGMDPIQVRVLLLQTLQPDDDDFTTRKRLMS
jgi:hypothetical protein